MKNEKQTLHKKEEGNEIKDEEWKKFFFQVEEEHWIDAGEEASIASKRSWYRGGKLDGGEEASSASKIKMGKDG